MVSIVVKKITGKEYLYLVESIRQKGKIIQKTLKYIGPKRPIPIEEFESMKLSFEKKDWVLKEFKDELSYTNHEELKKASKQYENFLKTLDRVSLEKEKQKFLSDFIASSNAIEGSTLTKKDTFDFLFGDSVPKNHTKKELFMAINLLEAWKYLEENCKRFPTHQDLFELHKRVNKRIEEDKTLGNYKKVQNYIGDVLTSSHLFVEERMNELLNWIRKAFRKIDNFEVAFQSHAQFEIIHPFVDGNGRVGRLLLNWLLMYKKLMPLAIQAKSRTDYIIALNNARKEKVEAICKFCNKAYSDQYSFVVVKSFK